MTNQISLRFLLNNKIYGDIVKDLCEKIIYYENYVFSSSKQKEDIDEIIKEIYSIMSELNSLSVNLGIDLVFEHIGE